MAITARVVEYFYTRLQDEPNQAYELLTLLASEGINVLAFSAVPFGPNHVELTIFPESAASLQALAKRSGWTLTGPQHAILVQGDDHLGMLAAIHKKLQDAGTSVYASSGVTDGHGHYGYLIYTKEGDHLRAEQALSQ